jgi:hypothetical protein
VEARVPGNTHYVVNDLGLVAGGVTVLLEHCGGDGNNSNIIKQQCNVGIDSEYDCHCSGKCNILVSGISCALPKVPIATVSFVMSACPFVQLCSHWSDFPEV